MRRSTVYMALISAAGLLALSTAAHATYLCDAATQLTGANDGRNPVVASRFGIVDNLWFADHKLQDGTIIHRADQYTMFPLPVKQGVGWSGYLKRANHLWMAGWLSNVSPDGAETVTYNEALHDTAKGDAIIMQSWTTCHAQHDNVPKQYVPPATQYVPPVAAQADSVAFTLTPNQQIMVKVTMGDMFVDMQLDTGANVSSIGADLADKLIAGNYAIPAASAQVTLADGSVVTERQITIKSLHIGRHTVNNVTVGVVKDGVTMLLGLPVLNSIGKFTIDSAKQQLTFG